MRPGPWTVICSLTISIFAASGQTQPRLEFEVASIKPAAPDARGMYIRPGPGGGVSITNMSLKELIVIAWRVQPFQISGGPAWLDSIHYDILAKPQTKPKQDEMPEMLQALLEDRFQLKLHRETKELPVYALVMARKDSRFGPGLTESKAGDCIQPDPSGPPGPPEAWCSSAQLLRLIDDGAESLELNRRTDRQCNPNALAAPGAHSDR